MHPWRVSALRAVDLDRPRVMAIINVTPDSFYDGGAHLDPHTAADAAARFVDEGADLLDVGGESTRPGSSRVDADEQIRRVVPVIEAIRTRDQSTPITIDTTRAGVAARALDAGADGVNDVSAGEEDPEMLPLVATRGAGIILMHRLTTPDRDAYSDAYEAEPNYDDVVSTVAGYLQSRADAARRAGIEHDAIVLDPGLGFGKSVEQNLDLIRRTGELTTLGYPILSGLSRKSFVGRVALGPSAASERLSATLGASVRHLASGAHVFRVHDVAAHVSALRLAWAIGDPAAALAAGDAPA